MERIAVVTGSSSGIGLALCEILILKKDYIDKVYGIDVNPIPDTSLLSHVPHLYKHIIADVADIEQLPEIDNVMYLVNNAGIQDSSLDRVIDVNLKGVINCTEKYALSSDLVKSVVNQASVSAHNGAEFPYYTASKGGVLSYTRWVAKELAKKRATCNSVSFGGVSTPLNSTILKNKELWDKIMDETPMKKWVTDIEAASWISFLLLENKSMSGQDLIIDNLEMLNHNFIWE